MKQIDFSKVGGFPLTQDTLDFMQQSYTDVLNAYASLGNISVATNTPYVITGMGTNGVTYYKGWFIYNGDIIQFPNDINSSMLPALISPAVYGYVISETATALTFNDGNSNSVLKVKAATIGAGLTISSTFIPLSTKLYSFQEVFGAAAKDTETHSVINAASGNITGNLYFRKNRLTNKMRIRGSLSVNTAISGPAVYNILSSGILPAYECPFIGVQTSGTVLDSGGIDYINTLAFSLDTVGHINMIAIKGASNYSVAINVELQLD